MYDGNRAGSRLRRGRLRSLVARRSGAAAVGAGVLVAALIAAAPSGAAAPYAPGHAAPRLFVSHAAAGPFALAFGDDFNGSSLDHHQWAVFNGAGNGKNGPKSAANAIVHDGMLTLRATRIAGVWTGAGIGNSPGRIQTYGKYVIRARFEPGAGVRSVALLWPTKGWPPEIDFMEIASMWPLRLDNMMTNHYVAPGQSNVMQHATHKADYRQWHDIGVEWTPTALRYTLDGTVVQTMTGHIPAVPMWLGLSVALGTGPYAPSAATPSKVDLDVDWVQVYRYIG